MLLTCKIYLKGLRLDFSKGGVCQLNKIQVIPEYYATFTIGD